MPNSDDALRDHYTTLETAKLLGMAVRSIQLMVDRGELEAWKTPGGHRRISRESVERWLQTREVGVPPSQGQGSGPAPARSAAARPKVLLIEDSVHYQNLIRLLLDQQFPDVALHVASDGIAGLAMCGKLDPDVLIVDILLPGLDGAALITSLRSHPQFARVQLIVVTSLEESERAPYAFALQGLTVIQKPALVAHLPQALRACLAATDRG
ncbi:response regulator [Acidovorax sp. GBBC 3334]|uniref:response regulator n=1 Tax=unclassified Acidovorax TaxID=2684926 RepID=UPI0023034BA9|nr:MULTISPECIES: response regulator [unclassified Acidovorax]MDA8455365.1 response regulator [Acidovorax sp. GBBC 3334]MDA8521436.1 response regulator [Acidovorax sp. NCPPB 4044]